MNDQERKAYEEAIEKLKEQDAILRAITGTPLVYAIVLSVQLPKKKEKDSFPTALVINDGKFIEVSCHPDKAKDLTLGVMVKLSSKTMAVVDRVDGFEFPAGELHAIRRVIDDGRFVEIDGMGTPKVVSYAGKTPEAGDRIMLDPTGSIAIKNFKKEDDQFVFGEETHITWDDIGGLEQAKEELIEAVSLPFRHPEIFQKYGKKRTKGVLLYGRPGNGKTLLAKAVATDIAKTFGRKTSTGFMYVKGPEILSKWVGESEATIRRIFRQAQEHMKKYNYPAVLFIDEADAILGKRGNGISSDMEKTIVPQFLAEMDGLEDSGAIVLLATNRPDTLDPAVIRDGRIDRKIRVSAPDQKTAADIFQIHLHGKPIHGDASMKEFAKKSAGELFSDRRVLYEITKKSGEKVSMSLSRIVNGAMISGVIEQATSFALRRDLKGGKVMGITCENVVEAVDRVFQQQKGLDHKDDILELVEQHDIRDVRKIMNITVGEETEE